ncbi:MAG: lytic transglycosylase domain-containing protein [Gemmatimonadaceae bacterium]
MTRRQSTRRQARTAVEPCPFADHVPVAPRTRATSGPGESRPRDASIQRRRASALTLAAVACLVAGPLACDGVAEGRSAAPRAAAPSALAAELALSNDPAVIGARAAIAEGRPYRATQLLAPALASAERRSPEVVLLAATAAAQWGGWAMAQSLLAPEPWLDQRFDGDGRELLTRAALARDDDASATTNAARAVASARTDSARGVRLTLLARALDRRDVLDSAAAAYRAAADLLPPAGDWLRLRAAGVTPDSAARSALYASLADTLARRRAPLVEAQSLERTADSLEAAAAYVRAGEPAAALRLRARLARDDAGRRSVRRELVALVVNRRGSASARSAATELIQTFAPLTGAEALAVGRSLAASGPLDQAADAFDRAAELGALTGDDRLIHARLLFRLGRYPQAAAQFERVPARHPDAGDAQYERAVALLRGGRVADSRAILRGIERAHPGDTTAIGRALFLLADLATDEGRDDDARDTFRYLADRYPSSSMAPRARFQAGIIAIADGAPRTAARELDTLARHYPEASDAVGAIYWAGRAWLQAGDSAAARAHWRTVLTRDPLSYYAVLAATRLDTAWWSPAGPARAASPAAVPTAAPVAGPLFARVDLLESLGLDPEAARERTRLTTIADSSVERLLATARAFQARGRSTTGIALGLRALRGGAPTDGRTYRTIYPVVHGDVLAAESRERGLDPALVAALIRQESSFLATARSPAGARGLMQIMPSVGRSVARSLGVTPWSDALLYQPDVNLRLGTAHLAALMAQYDALPHVLAAYNAGGSRVTRWRRKGGAADPELFVERIPYAETRDYVRIVTRNRALYGELYGWNAAE